MKSAYPIILIIVGILIFILNVTYINPLSNVNIDELEKTTATLDEQYTERIVTIKGLKVTSYDVSFTYEINGVKYNRKETIYDEPNKKMTVYYKRSNPKRAMIKYLSEPTRLGLIIAAIGILCVISGVIWFIVVKILRIFKK